MRRHLQAVKVFEILRRDALSLLNDRFFKKNILRCRSSDGVLMYNHPRIDACNVHKDIKHSKWPSPCDTRDGIRSTHLVTFVHATLCHIIVQDNLWFLVASSTTPESCILETSMTALFRFGTNETNTLSFWNPNILSPGCLAFVGRNSGGISCLFFYIFPNMFVFQDIMQEWDVCAPIIVAVLNRRHESLHNISRSVSHLVGSWRLFSLINLQVAAVESLCIT